MENEADRKEAAEIFLRMLISRCHDTVIKGLLSYLANGPPGRKPSENKVRRHQWFQSLDDETRAQVEAVIREAVEAALFGSLVLLDGMTGGNPIEGKTSDFALLLQTYHDDSAREENRFETAIRINPASAVDSLHDIFKRMLDEHVEGRESEKV